ncbi:PIN domain-containing protein [Neorhizobium sp. JUb45]|uniref:PIN domain-containing protein n=1 Tax=unclassified Neorhizobium TaxID=2629175 RepID=UPI001045A577|nr:PIN domain-containing protein [Neorhizobium sp. JUb45]
MIADTNVLVRVWAGDDAIQAAQAQDAMAKAQHIYVPVPAFCEFVWVLRQIYRLSGVEIAGAIRTLISNDRVIVQLDAVTAGLSFLDAGGDFADGIVEFEGRRLGGRVFATFDRRAAMIIRGQGRECLLLGSK